MSASQSIPEPQTVASEPGKDYTAGEEILDSYGGGVAGVSFLLPEASGVHVEEHTPQLLGTLDTGKNDTNLLVHYGFLAEDAC